MFRRDPRERSKTKKDSIISEARRLWEIQDDSMCRF